MVLYDRRMESKSRPIFGEAVIGSGFRPIMYLNFQVHAYVPHALGSNAAVVFLGGESTFSV